MSSSRQQKARQAAERRRLEREPQRGAGVGRGRVALLVGASAAVALIAALGVTFATADGPDRVDEKMTAEETQMLAAEAAAEAQSSAAAEDIAAGDVVAEDYTVEPGTPVASDRLPVPDDRPVACGASSPANATATRSRYPGGPAEVLRDGVDYVATIETSCGRVVVDLLEEDAPKAVNSFVFLADEGYYDGLEVFRDFGGIAAVHAGSGDNTVDWDIGYRLPDELQLAERDGYPIGTVTTVGEGPYTGGSDFYIVYGKEFDAGFQTDRTQTAFGRVLSGMKVIDTVTKLERVGMGGETFAARLFLESVTIERR